MSVEQPLTAEMLSKIRNEVSQWPIDAKEAWVSGDLAEDLGIEPDTTKHQGTLNEIQQHLEKSCVVTSNANKKLGEMMADFMYDDMRTPGMTSLAMRHQLNNPNASMEESFRYAKIERDRVKFEIHVERLVRNSIREIEAQFGKGDLLTRMLLNSLSSIVKSALLRFKANPEYKLEDLQLCVDAAQADHINEMSNFVFSYEETMARTKVNMSKTVERSPIHRRLKSGVRLVRMAYNIR